MTNTTDPWRLAADLGLTVIESRGRHAGGYRPDDNTVRLAPHLPARAARSVLMHEIAHHILGHRPSVFGPVRERQEITANRWAAQHLITPADYADTEQRRDGHLPSMAYDLGVTVEIVDAYQALLLRTETSVYVNPRMGARQWTAKLDA